MITASQIRAGRALLGLTSRQLAAEAGISWSTIKRFEDAEGVPQSKRGTLDRLKSYLEENGIEFLGDPIDSPGVRLHRKPLADNSKT